MSNTAGTKGEEVLKFDAIDAEIFKIPDIATRLATLQGYFFPRMDRLALSTVSLIREIYDVDPLETMTVVHRPNHRGDAKANIDTAEVYVGLSAKRSGQALHVYRDDGTPYRIWPSFLVFATDESGCLRASFRPFYVGAESFRVEVRKVFSAHWDKLLPILEACRIAAVSERPWTTLQRSLSDQHLSWDGPAWHFPLSDDAWLFRLKIEFGALFPLIDTTTRLARGEPARLDVLLSRFRDWHDRLGDAEDPAPEMATGGDALAPVIDGLGSYSMFRPGLWWDILMRDRWTCNACGRTSRDDGVRLEVDHILPRSKGGTDHPTNLQVLCRKCNIGKSNRDATDLRR